MRRWGLQTLTLSFLGILGLILSPSLANSKPISILLSGSRGVTILTEATIAVTAKDQITLDVLMDDDPSTISLLASVHRDGALTTSIHRPQRCEEPSEGGHRCFYALGSYEKGSRVEIVVTTLRNDDRAILYRTSIYVVYPSYYETTSGIVAMEGPDSVLGVQPGFLLKIFVPPRDRSLDIPWRSFKNWTVDRGSLVLGASTGDPFLGGGESMEPRVLVGMGYELHRFVDLLFLAAFPRDDLGHPTASIGLVLDNGMYSELAEKLGVKGS